MVASVTGKLQPRVLLVSPPWTSLNEPSLGLAVLSAVLKEQGIAVRVVHLNLFMLDILRSETYSALARIYALNDFIFSGLIDPQVTPSQMRLLREKCAELVSLGTIDHRKYGGVAGVVTQILRLRETVPQWVEEEVARLLSWQPTLVGFTCMFDQTISSVAIASRIKAANSDVMIALGGYAVRSPTGEMLLEAFPWIDAICTGEGEPCIASLAYASSADGTDLRQVPNLLYRDDAGQVSASVQAKPVDMNLIPAPDFDDFFAEVAQIRRELAIDIAIDRLPLENSRGCWWGATHHCVFCGIHDDDMVYRARSADVVLKTLDSLSERYNCREFRFADYILPHGYYATLLPQLVERGAPYRLKCELKSNINEQRLKLLVDAGFIEVQPGVESFSSSALRSMNKGVSGIQNVYLLLLARRYGITILYNILYGLPDDDPEAVEAMARALPSLMHLDPPATRGRIQITRFSPLHSDPERFGFGVLRHEKSYDLIFSSAFLRSSGFDLDRYCYMFELPFEPSSRLSRAHRAIELACDDWVEKDRQHRIDLFYEDGPEGALIIADSRQQPPLRYPLTMAQGTLLLGAETPSTREALHRLLPNASREFLDAQLEVLAKYGLIFEDNSRLISLVLPRNDVSERRHWWNNYRTRWKRVAESEEKIGANGIGSDGGPSYARFCSD